MTVRTYHIYDRLWHWARPLLEKRLKRLAEPLHPGYAEGIAERFGVVTWPETLARPVWVHAVSVGETRAAQPLIAAIRRLYPTLPVLLTHMTPTGRETGANAWSSDPLVRQAWAPYDHSAWVAAFVAATRPRALLLMETELWPNWLRVAQETAMPVALINARLSERSFRRYRRWQRWLPIAWEALTLIAAQTADDAERFRELGAKHVVVTGNLKFDQTPNPELVALGKSWQRHLGNRAALVWASTRDGEEKLLLDAWERLLETFPPQWRAPLLVIVPRHPERCDAVGALLTQRRYQWARRSETLPNPGLDVWLGDSLGEMTAYYTLARAALIGGSWKPFGGQNPLEAIAAGCPPVVGPHVFHFAELVTTGRRSRAIVQCPDPEAGLRYALRLLHSAELHAEHVAQGALFLAAHRGATERTMATVAPLLTPSAAERDSAADGVTPFTLPRTTHPPAPNRTPPAAPPRP
ncbi:3-deoxy-D-manno-octulosonic acid transferase [Hydrogenophilus thermoluteolus]|nr:3-deoxy-D-manno-octulosonic acid transferase [Hydrogenophilus thermoluteolus]MBW7657703.1 3-deoxy-D-manno-octulosonic acid transferase [Hydrogenophilus thermoluteolus]